MLFNVDLDAVPKNNRKLQEHTEAGKFIAFADDLLLFCNSKAQAEELIREVEKLQPLCVNLNKAKTTVIGDSVNVGYHIAGVEVKASMKYLGFRVSCDKQMLIGDAMTACKKYVQANRNKLNSESEEVNHLVFSCYNRSHLL